MLVFLLTVLLCGFLDRRDIKGLGFIYFDQYFYSFSMQLAAHHNVPLSEWIKQHFLIVEINDNTFSLDNPEHLPGPPVPRLYQAKVLNDLKRAGARLVVYDLIFRQPSPNTKYDKDFAVAAAKPGAKVVWASLIENEDLSARLVKPITPLAKASPFYGHILSPQESERLVVQQIKSVYEVNGQQIPALSFEAVRLFEDLEKAPLQKTSDGWQAGDLTAPEFININYVLGPEGSPFPVVPFEQVYNGAVDDPFYKENNFFKDKIVIVGDTTTVGNDYRNTPIGYMPGVQIQAQAISSLLMAYEGRQHLIVVPSATERWLLMLTLTAFSCWVASHFAIFRAAVFAVFLMIGYVLLEINLFINYQFALNTMAPLLSIALPSALILIERGLSAEKEKTYMRSMLQRYVSPAVANFLLLHPEQAILQSKKVNATVLFADLRNFTRITRDWEPEETLKMLNQFFQVMSEVIFRHEGTVDKFLGDGLMAIFGAPLSHPDHAYRSVSAAIEMQQALEQLRREWAAQGLPDIRMGIGIATGPMVVGNMGYDRRTDFSVIGDTVNLASRLENLNKDLDSEIIFTESTWQDMGSEISIPLEGPINVSVRGHDLPVSIFLIASTKTETAEA